MRRLLDYFSDLNTTHVSVQFYVGLDRDMKDKFKYNPCIGSIVMAMKSVANSVGFKYNPCIGSICKSNGWELKALSI